MGGCDWQPLAAALAALLVAVTPGCAALLVAVSNRQTIARIPVKRASDAVDLAELRKQLDAITAQLPLGGGGASENRHS